MARGHGAGLLPALRSGGNGRRLTDAPPGRLAARWRSPSHCSAPRAWSAPRRRRAARSLGLLTLAAGMPAERFAHYATAFVLSELARCATDFGLDPLVLRRAEGLSARRTASDDPGGARGAACAWAGGGGGRRRDPRRLVPARPAAARRGAPVPVAGLASARPQLAAGERRCAPSAPALFGFYGLSPGWRRAPTSVPRSAFRSRSC